VRGRGLASSVATMGAAALAMAAAAFLSAQALEAATGGQGLFGHLVVGLVPVAVGGVTYASLARLLRVPEMDELLALVLRR
jgi:hypothetical protein